jgi:hypothetical protein
MPSLSNEQRRICRKFGASCLLSGDHLKMASAEPSTRYDERILAMTTRLNLMDKRWEELRERKGLAAE